MLSTETYSGPAVSTPRSIHSESRRLAVNQVVPVQLRQLLARRLILSVPFPFTCAVCVSQANRVLPVCF